MIYFILILISLSLGAGIVFVILRPKHKKDVEIENLNQQLYSQANSLSAYIDQLELAKQQTQDEYVASVSKLDEVKKAYDISRANLENAQAEYNQSLSNIKDIANLEEVRKEYAVSVSNLEKIKEEYKISAQQLQEAQNNKNLLQAEANILKEQYDNSTQQLEKIKSNLANMEAQAKEASTQFYQENMAIAKEKLEAAIALEQQEFEKTKAEYAKSFLQTMEESAASFIQQATEQKEKCAQLENRCNELQSNVEAAVAAAKRAEEIKTQADFYKLQLSDIDIEEIHILRSIAPRLRDAEPLNKVIWKVYYEKPTTDLIGRVIGSGVHTGIYKITNLDNGKCYIGQASSLSDRWKQHIKRGIGADPPTRNKLYPAMLAIGVEHFSFEVVEECNRDQLDEREDYWQDYFKAKEFGYSIK